jgi:hypothetical protein
VDPQAVALNETYPAFGVSLFPVHSRKSIDSYRGRVSLASARLSWRLSDICCACTFLRRAALLFPYYSSPTILLSSSQFLSSSLNTLMSHTQSSSTPSNFQIILGNALNAYKKRTKKDLLKHPLADRLRACDSPSSILTVLQEQVQELNESQRSNERLTKWLDPTVNVLHAFSETLGGGVGLVSLRT